MLLSLLLLVGVAAAQRDDPCVPSPCGVNTVCTSRGRTARCECEPGWNHAPGRNTIDGCPIRIRDQDRGRPSVGGGRPRPFVSVSRPRVVSGGFGGQRIGDPCAGNPCGQGAECRPVGERPLCTCLPNHTGDPYTRCELDPCENSPCGINAECSSNGARAICKCPRGYTGDPFVRCDDNPCNANPSPCGPNADCTNNGNRAICRCRDGYEGDPFTGCTVNPCINSPCGINAECTATGTRAVCNCIRGYEGDPFSRCNLNPCFDNPCGPNADCQASGSSAVCRCKEGYVGDPFVNCNLEPCSTNPCGVNAECQSQGRTAVCTCPRGYTGDPYTNCRQDPCSTDPCGNNAVCENQGQSAVCKCPPQYIGDPYISCSYDPCGASDTCGPNTNCEVSGERALCKCRSGHVGSPYSRSGCRADPCSSDICGVNAECRNAGGRPVCECLPGHVGEPYRECFRGECVSNSDCNTNQACQDYNCVDPCSFSCGPGADCTAQNHVAICRCPRGFTGDPFQNCRRFTRDEICEACGANTDCEVGPDDRPICKCKQNFIGNPLSGCRYECQSDFECGPSQTCLEFKCQAACRPGVCGENANCVARNNRATCTCPEDFLGDPYSRCYTECTRHEDCAQDAACVRFKCKDPCREPDPNVCGRGANCEPKNHKPICSCPRGFTGDPFVSCRQFTKQDLCDANTCGRGATCQPGFDRSGNDRPVCTCPSGYRGDPLVECRRGDCDSDRDCPVNQACYNFNCEDPCLNACGSNAECLVRNHGAVCSCPGGYVGDPLTACRRSRTSSVIGSRRFRRYLPAFLEFLS